MKVSFSPRARDDLIEIGLYIAADNPRRALSFIDELEERCAALGNTPGIGVARPALGRGIRMLPHGRYLIFYRHAQRTLRIERILHSARQIESDDVEQQPDDGGD